MIVFRLWLMVWWYALEWVQEPVRIAGIWRDFSWTEVVGRSKSRESSSIRIVITVGRFFQVSINLNRGFVWAVVAFFDVSIEFQLEWPGLCWLRGRWTKRVVVLVESLQKLAAGLVCGRSFNWLGRVGVGWFLTACGWWVAGEFQVSWYGVGSSRSE